MARFDGAGPRTRSQTLRSYPHDIDEDILEEHFFVKQVHYKTRSAKAAMAQAQRDVGFFNSRHVEARQLAALAYALEEEVDLVRTWLGVACDHAATSLHLGDVPTAFVYMTHLSVAILCDRDALRQQLEEAEPGRSERTPELFVRTARAFRELSANRLDDAREKLAEARQLAADEKTTRDAREVMHPYLELMTAIVDHDSAALEKAMSDAHAELADTFNDSMGVDCDGLIDFIGLGLMQLAIEVGDLRPPDVSIYLPPQLLRAP